MKHENDLWTIFANSGKIDDYLKYRRTVKEVEKNDVIEHSGYSYPGADASGKRPDDLDLN